MMHRIKEGTLNGFLAVLVVLSIMLSAQAWYPSERVGGLFTKGPSVQVSPPSQEVIMPEVFRPERIYVRQKDSAVALLPAGSVPYKRLWREVQDILIGLNAVTAPTHLDEETEQDPTDVVTLVMPLSLTVQQWAEQWQWETSGLRNFSLKVDRITLQLGATPVIRLAGPTGAVYRVSPIAQVSYKGIKEIVTGLEPAQFATYRPLALKDSSLRIMAGLLVPATTEMPVAALQSTKPDYTLEKARYFPDLSVVRQIDEKDARSFTDGQRWLRITSGGQLEYSLAHTPGIAPDLARAKTAVSEWVGSHGGWPQELVLGWYTSQPGRTVLRFDLRMDGPFPVESSEGALRLELTTSRAPGEEPITTVTHFKRYPELIPAFSRTTLPVITPERALQRMSGQFAPLLLFEEVREMHLAYLIAYSDKVGANWVLEPIWVIQVGEKRIFMPASATSDLQPFVGGA
jgi:regulatory protein YycH of two-component signal transduction system YycFG